MSDVVWAAIILAISGTFTLVLTDRMTSARRKEDWAREDEREARAEMRSELAMRVANATHTVANSNLTEAIRGRLAAMEGQLATLRNLADPSVEELATMEALHRETAELILSLAHRDEQSDVAAQITANLPPA